MSVKDYDKVIQIEDSTTGNIIQVLDYGDLSFETINSFSSDLIWKYVIKNEHNLTFKLGYKSR